MKRLKMLFLTLWAVLIPTLTSCNDEEGYSIGDFTTPSWATLSITGDGFYLTDDIWGKLWPVNQHLNSTATSDLFEDGQRVIITFNPLSDKYYGFDHAVKLLSIQEVLTKDIETLTPENDEAYGNAPITIAQGNLTISGNHLNIIYQQDIPSQAKHRISLLRPASDNELYGSDGYIHLQLRYNTYNDVSGYLLNNAVSFNLNSLDIPAGTQGIKLKLQSSVNGEVEVELPFIVSEGN